MSGEVSLSTSNLPDASGPKEQVIRALSSSPNPLDAYQVAKLAGVTPMQAGRTLAKLALKGVVKTEDPLGSDNDLSARYALVAAGT